jgi:t-SNARE complex subunit (syntaxin)
MPQLGGKVNARAGLHAADKGEIRCILQGVQRRLFGILACSLVVVRT